jgi:hypothetical protein
VTWAKETVNVTLEIVARTGRGFVVQAKRQIVERTLAWIGRFGDGTNLRGIRSFDASGGDDEDRVTGDRDEGADVVRVRGDDAITRVGYRDDSSADRIATADASQKCAGFLSETTMDSRTSTPWSRRASGACRADPSRQTCARTAPFVRRSMLSC